MSKIWITRPKVDAQRFSDDLDAADLSVSFHSVLSSLLDAEFLDLDPQLFLNEPSVGAFVATSRNGVRAFSKMSGFHQFTDLPFFTVGKATGQLARSLGFKDVRVGSGRAQELLPLLREFDQSEKRAAPFRFVNLRGDEQAFSLKDGLLSEKTAFTNLFEDVFCYRMKEADDLPLTLLNELKNNEITGVVLMSPRTARVYGRLMKRYDLKQQVAVMQHFCLSEAVAEGLRGELQDGDLGFEPSFVQVSAFPSQADMIECVKDTLNDRK